MTASNGYLKVLRGVLDHLEQTQMGAVERAADLICESLVNGGTINCSEIGHGIQWDFINRAGGLLAVQPFSFTFNVQNAVPECRVKQQPANPDADLERIRFAVEQSNLRSGDIMIVSSVSGRNRGPVELALACRAKGVKVIGLTSLAYTANVTSLHPCGKRLYEVVDVVIDNGAPYGDAAVDIAGYDCKVVPVSGGGMLATGWMIFSRVLEKLAAAGSPPSFFISHNREGGPEFNDRSRAQYKERGF